MVDVLGLWGFSSLGASLVVATSFKPRVKVSPFCSIFRWMWTMVQIHSDCVFGNRTKQPIQQFICGFLMALRREQVVCTLLCRVYSFTPKFIRSYNSDGPLPIPVLLGRPSEEPGTSSPAEHQGRGFSSPHLSICRAGRTDVVIFRNVMNAKAQSHKPLLAVPV